MKYSPSQIESIYTEPLSIALSDFKSDHHFNHSFEDPNNIIWSVCESNNTVYKSDPKSKLKKKKTVPRLRRGLGTSKENSMLHSISGKVRVNLLMVIAISIIATKNRI